MIQKISELNTYAANQDGSFNVINLGGFVAAIYVAYTQNGESFSYASDSFSLFYSKEIAIPKDATDIHLYALVSDGSGQWIPIYNNNFLTAGTVALKLYGTIFSPQVAILSDPNPTTLRVLATNKAGFITRFKVIYTFNNLVYTMESQNFTAGMTREIALPYSATDVSVFADFFNGINWINLYNKAIPNSANLDLIFTGIITHPVCEENITTPPSGGTGTAKKKATLVAAKKPDKTVASLNDTITFAINISNASSTPARTVILKEVLPKELKFVPKSFKVNGITFEDIDFSSSTISLDDIQMYSSILITYQVEIISLPSSNKFMNAPVLMFNYLDENNNLQIASSTGSVIPISTGDSPTNPTPCCCCCCCPCNCQPTS